jgi:hypothetical protein
MKTRLAQLFLATLTAVACKFACCAEIDADPALKVLILRHGEKPASGENLTCQGENRALRIPGTLYKKFGKIDYIYVPTVVSRGGKTLHSRMFQTATPIAIRNGLDINSQYSGTDADLVAQSVLGKKGTVLLVWNHSAIAKLAQSLGATAPTWKDEDFDSILVISYPKGKAVLANDAQEISPSPKCDGH